MNVTIGYTVFNKGHLLPKIIDGITRLGNIPSIFIFDACKDNSIEEFKKHRHELLNYKAFINTGKDLFEQCSNNFLLKNFDTQYCILLQDDMVIKGIDFIKLGLQIYRENENVGLIGFKDGYDMEVLGKYENMISSPWSQSKSGNFRLNPGQYENKMVVNRGPILFSKRLIEQVGYFDEASYFPQFWDDTDYCFRCLRAGLKNYVAYSEIESDLSWASYRSVSSLTTKKYHSIFLANQIRFSRRWKMPIPRIKYWKILIALKTDLIMKIRYWNRIRHLDKKVFELT